MSAADAKHASNTVSKTILKLRSAELDLLEPCLPQSYKPPKHFDEVILLFDWVSLVVEHQLIKTAAA